jgi:hypothetical protein
MKIEKYNENNNAELNQTQISEIMRLAVEYDRYIEDMDTLLSNIISTRIEPLLKNGEFDDAKDMVREFYKQARRKRDEDGTEGDVVFIGYDIIFARINRLKMDIKKYNI